MSVDSARGRSPLPPPTVIACLAATWLIWGSTYLAIKWALVSFPPFFQMGTRFLLAGGILLAWSRGVSKAAMPSPRQWRNALVVGALMLGCGMGGTAVAEQSIGSGLVVAFIAVMPMMIIAVNRLFGVRPRRLELVGIAVGFLGVLLLTRGAGFRASPAGLGAVTIACGGWAVGSVLSQRTFALAAGAMGYATEMLCGSLILLMLAWATGERPRWPPTLRSTLAWAYLVVFGSLVAFNAYMALLSRTSVALASSYSFVNPLIALLLGVAVGGETVSSQEWLACAIVLAGVALLLWQRRLDPGDL
ncbi:putative transporter, EamA-like family [Burkholderiales bacterium]|nr:putative transporter, EamA-like family [Burkholderiales bacterium]